MARTYPTTSTHKPWTEDELTALRAACERVPVLVSQDVSTRTIAKHICDGFYDLAKERLRTPAALYAKAYDLKLGLPPKVNTWLQQLGKPRKRPEPEVVISADQPKRAVPAKRVLKGDLRARVQYAILGLDLGVSNDKEALVAIRAALAEDVDA